MNKKAIEAADAIMLHIETHRGKKGYAALGLDEVREVALAHIQSAIEKATETLRAALERSHNRLLYVKVYDKGNFYDWQEIIDQNLEALGLAAALTAEREHDKEAIKPTHHNTCPRGERCACYLTGYTDAEYDHGLALDKLPAAQPQRSVREYRGILKGKIEGNPGAASSEPKWTPEYVKALIHESPAFKDIYKRLSDAHNAVLAVEQTKSAQFAAAALKNGQDIIRLEGELAAERKLRDRSDRFREKLRSKYRIALARVKERK